MQLLHQAGAPLTAEALLHAVDSHSADGVEVLLACGTPAVDTAQPGATVFYLTSYSCAIHRALRAYQTRFITTRYSYTSEHSTLRILEALLAAGFRPTVYKQVAPPRFLRRAGNAVMEEFDNFVEDPTNSRLPNRLLFVARGGALDWTTSAHNNWPDRFKAATRALLLAAHRSARNSPRQYHGAGSSKAACPATSAAATGLASPPHDLLLHVVRLAASPMSAWV